MKGRINDGKSDQGSRERNRGCKDEDKVEKYPSTFLFPLFVMETWNRSLDRSIKYLGTFPVLIHMFYIQKMQWIPHPESF